jgi:hypothetical protein
MATELIIFPEINPISMNYQQGNNFFADTIPLHEEQVAFCQKAEADDVYYLVFAMPADTVFDRLQAGLYNCDGVKVLTYTPTVITQTATEDYVYYKVTVAFFGATVDRLYTVRVTISDSAPGQELATYTFESEPIYLRTSWPSTILLKYRNEINDFDCGFFEENEDFYFYTRIEGGFPSSGFQPKAKDEIFTDQNYIPTMLDSIPYVVRQIQFGAAVGIANWQADAINRSMSCTEWYVDGVRYCKEKANEELQATHSTHYPLSGYTINVIGVVDDYGSAFKLSRIFVLGSGDLAFRSGPGTSMFIAPPEIA